MPAKKPYKECPLPLTDASRAFAGVARSFNLRLRNGSA